MLRAVLPALLLFCAAPAGADVLPSPARWGDVSLGLGPAFVAGEGGFGGGLAAEANLLWEAFSLGVKARGTLGEDGDLRPAAGVEASVLGLVGAGASLQEGGPSIDLLVQAPLPVGSSPFYFTVGYRPQFLLGEGGGVIHELSVQLKWTTLLLPDDG